MKLILTVLSIFFFINCNIYAKKNKCSDLFTNDKPKDKSIVLVGEISYKKKYPKKLFKIEVGDTFRIKDKIYTSYGFLGSGSSNRVYDIGDNKVIRLPFHKLNMFKGFSDQTAKLSILSYYNIAKELSVEGIRVPKVYEEDSVLPFALVVEKIPVKISASEFFIPKLVQKKMNLAEIELAKEQFIEFLSRFWKYENIGDLKLNQIVYTGTEWVLLDFYYFGSTGHFKLRNFNIESFPLSTKRVEFEGYFNYRQLPIEIEERVKKIL